MTADVLLKNMPLSFLKEQGSSFFDSESFASAVDLFNKYKSPVTDEGAMTEGELVLPIAVLTDKLVASYFERSFTPETDSQRVDLIFIALSSKETLKTPLFKQRRVITKTVSGVTSALPFLTTDIGTVSVFSAGFAKGKNNAKQKDRSVLDELLRPAKTLIPIKDVVNSSKFYSSVTGVNVYDDVKYKELIAQRFIANNAIFSLSAVPTDNIKARLAAAYPDLDRDVSRAIESLTKSLVSRYFSYNGYDEDVSLGEDGAVKAESFSIDTIKNILSAKSSMYPLSVFKGFFLDTVNVSITHSRSTAVRFEVFDESGTRITTEVIGAVSTNGVLTFKLPRATSGTVLILYDRRASASINDRSLRQYSADLRGEKFSRYKITTDRSTNMVVLPVVNYNREYFFAEFYDEKMQRVEPTNVSVTAEEIRITFDQIIDNGEAILLPTHKVLGGVAYTAISEDNILAFLSATDLFAKEVKAWRGATHDR